MRERERHQCEREIDWLPPECTLMGDRTQHRGMCPDGKSNLQPCGVRDGTQPTEPPGQGGTWDILNMKKGCCDGQRTTWGFLASVAKVIELRVVLRLHPGHQLRP